MTKRNLILIHRGPEYERDFDEIATKVHALDNNITIYHLPAALNVKLPQSAWAHPTLTVALTPNFRLEIKRGPVLRNQPIEKLAQQDIFRKNAIPTPPALPFRFGMKLDPIMFGEFVVLKPTDLRMTSHGDGIFLFRRKKLETLSPNSLASTHPLKISAHSFIVQRFIDTGPFPSSIRVQTLLGSAIYCYSITLKTKRADLTSHDEVLGLSSIASNAGERSRALTNDAEAIRIAERLHAALPSIPCLGVDFVRDIHSKRLLVLECNAGGNTWHFSSQMGRGMREYFGKHLVSPELRNEYGRDSLINQFGAFDIAATKLTASVHALAS